MTSCINFFKTTNKFICINFDHDVVKKINKNDHPALKTIHIFVLDSGQIETDSLRIMAPIARSRKIKIIIHCFDKWSKNELKKRLKGVPKDKYFHFSLDMSREFKVLRFNLNPNIKEELIIDWEKNTTIVYEDYIVRRTKL